MILQVLMKVLAATGALWSGSFLALGLKAYWDGSMPFQAAWVGSIAFGCNVIVCFYVLCQEYRK